MKRRVKFAILGYGSRGHDAYAIYKNSHPDRMDIAAVCDTDERKLLAAKEEFALSDEQLFSDADELLSRPRLADVLIIATQDKDHVRYALPAIEKGYHLLLEKPVSPDPAECLSLLKAAHEKGRFVIVCHVLRYAQFYIKLKELTEKGKIGRLLHITAAEDIGFWHFAHSYVRGNWANEEASSPLILAKSCHDTDIIRWLAGRKCVKVSSFGSLGWFKEENAPEGAAARCLSGCRAKEECPFDCEKIYFDDPYIGYNGAKNRAWPLNVVTPGPVSREKLYEALKEGPYGRCVYFCGNDVCDHQIVNMEFEGGLTASFTVCAFTKKCCRTIKITGSKGEIEGRFDEGLIFLRRFGKEDEVFKVSTEDAGFAGHGDGDARIMDYMCSIIEDNDESSLFAIDESVESHLIAMAAEYSRKKGGQAVTLKEFSEMYRA